MSQLVQPSPTVRPRAASLSTPPWQIAVLTGLLLWLYVPILVRLVVQWWSENDYYGHGFFVPLFSAFVLWQGRERLARVSRKPSRSGLLILAFALCILMLGSLGAELFLARFSLLLVLAGLTVLFLGWRFFRAILFPWAFLLLMIPIPAILFNQITFPLQLLASRLSADVLEFLGVPVRLEGNVLQLAAMPLNVAEACSGIRSLMSLLTLAIIYGYLMERRLWVRWLLALASLPIAIVANSVRIIGTGLLVQYGYAEQAEGYFHASWGIIIFVISLLILYGLHALIRLLWPDEVGPVQTSATIPLDTDEPEPVGASPISNFAIATLMITAVALLLQFRGGREVFPPRLALSSFPQQLQAWTGTDIPIAQDTLQVLGHGEFLRRLYQSNTGAPWVDLFIAYFPSQRAGDTPHSPQHCLPGSGWTPVENQRITLVLPGQTPFPANLYVLTKDNAREIVLYWFWAHGRGVASEYWNKYYLIKDAIQLNRTDGALVRIIIPMSPDESPTAALNRLLPFASQVTPQLDHYIPR